MKNALIEKCSEGLKLMLSPYAAYIVECDKSAFSSYSSFISPFLNRVILNFWAESNAFLEPVKKFRYLGNIPLRIYLAPALVDELDDIIPNDRVKESYAYNNKFSKSRFIAAVLEEYAKLPFVDRESVFYHEQFEQIRNTIDWNDGKSKHIIAGTAVDGKKFEIYPVAIEKDEWSTYNYVIGFAAENYALVPISMRLSKIKTAARKSIKHSQLSTVSDKHISSLYQKVNECGIMFMSAHSKTVTSKLRFTKQGRDMYNNMSFLRPKFTELEEGEEGGCVMTFECTERQMLNYFRKFGDQLEVLESDELRKQFEDFFKKGLYVYEDK